MTQLYHRKIFTERFKALGDVKQLNAVNLLSKISREFRGNKEAVIRRLVGAAVISSTVVRKRG